MELPQHNSEDAPLHLESDGWVRQFVASGERLSELEQLYRSLGKEVKLIKTASEFPELPENCRACLTIPTAESYTIWTRIRK